jgi:hypothetical protein
MSARVMVNIGASQASAAVHDMSARVMVNVGAHKQPCIYDMSTRIAPAPLFPVWRQRLLKRQHIKNIWEVLDVLSFLHDELVIGGYDDDAVHLQQVQSRKMTSSN